MKLAASALHALLAAPVPDDVLARIRHEDPERSKVDWYERVHEQGLKQNAIVLAWFAWQAANTAERIPRP